MSVNRVWRWTCDHCKLTVDREDPGLPAGWIFVKAVVITHRCPECRELIPDAQQGHPQIVAQK
jgi:hypothetical protein